MKILRIYLALNFKRSIEYRENLILGIIGLIAVNFGSLFVLYSITNRFQTIAGWNFAEITFNYSLFLACLGLHKIFFRNIINLEDYIIDGSFDRFLLRPLNIFCQLCLEWVNYCDFSDFALGITGIAISLTQSELSLSFDKYIWLALLIINGAFVFTIILAIISSGCFWLYKSYPILYSTMEIQEIVQNYPISIFKAPFRFIVTYIIPYAAINYYPSLIVLDRKMSCSGFYVVIYLVILDIILFIAFRAIWHTGIKNYKSSGT